MLAIGYWLVASGYLAVGYWLSGVPLVVHGGDPCGITIGGDEGEIDAGQPGRKRLPDDELASRGQMAHHPLEIA